MKKISKKRIDLSSSCRRQQAAARRAPRAAVRGVRLHRGAVRADLNRKNNNKRIKLPQQSGSRLHRSRFCNQLRMFCCIFSRGSATRFFTLLHCSRLFPLWIPTSALFRPQKLRKLFTIICEQAVSVTAPSASVCRAWTSAARRSCAVAFAAPQLGAWGFVRFPPGPKHVCTVCWLSDELDSTGLPNERARAPAHELQDVAPSSHVTECA